MWDEIAGVALIDPSIITGQQAFYTDIDIDHGPSYGKTLFWDAKTKVPPYMRLANVQFDIDDVVTTVDAVVHHCQCRAL
jgi:inosine-uridine nucleoside N-ribohydrolase